MDITEVSVSQDSKWKRKKPNKPKNKSGSKGGNGGADTKEEVKMEKSEAEIAFPPTFNVSEIKNKQRRHSMFVKYKQEKSKVKIYTYTSKETLRVYEVNPQSTSLWAKTNVTAVWWNTHAN